MSGCYFPESCGNEAMCRNCGNRRAKYQAVIDAARAWYYDDWPDDEAEPTYRLRAAVRALDGEAGHRG